MWLPLISFVMEFAKSCVAKTGSSLATVAPFSLRWQQQIFVHY
jgi:hypothetical protein